MPNSSSKPSNSLALDSGWRIDESMPKEDPPPFASILLAPEKRVMPTLIWRTGVGCGEENWRMELHDPSTCVEPCIHNPLIYRPTKPPTVPAVNGPSRTGHTKSLHLFKLTLKYANGMAPTRPATAAPLGARSLHDPPMGGGPEWRKTRHPRYNDKTRRPALRFHDPSAGHQDGPDPVTPCLVHTES